MYVQKGFISVTRWNNNTPGQVAVLGELSEISKAYAREKGLYSDNTVAPDLLLTTFISKDESTTIQAPSVIVAQVLAVAQQVIARTDRDGVDVDQVAMLESLLTNFAGKADSFQSGQLITDGVHTLPEWLSWHTSADSTRPDNYIKIWFVDGSFQQQYDEYEIYVIPPFDTVDNFFLPAGTVRQMLDAVSSADKGDRIQAAKQGYPEAILRIQTYLYVDPLNTSNTIPTDWAVLIYGAAGDNIDSIKDALEKFILAHSQRTRDQWIPILPDIFKRTEVILLPLWDQMAIPNREVEVGVYSPQITLATAVAKMKQFATQYPPAHIDSNVQAMGYPYQSLAILSVGSPDNRDAKFKLSDIFPDLIMALSTSSDFNKMSGLTQGWANMLAYMIVTAEKMTEFTSNPVGYRKVTRDGILYLTRTYNNINYLVVAKSSVLANPAT